ncbi:MAG: hypothetical protein Q9218_002365 [Villophora microphyllina]
MASPTTTTTPRSSTGPSDTDTKPDVDLTLEKQLAILQQRFQILEQKFSHLHEHKIALTEDETDKITDVSVNSCIPVALPNVKKQSEAVVPDATSRAKILINKYDRASGERKDERLVDVIPDPTEVNDTSHAFILRKNIERFSSDNDGELEIVSPDLWNLLKKLLSRYPYHIFQGEPVPISSPYEAIIFNWNELEAAAKESVTDEKDIQARQDLKLLLDTLISGSGDAKLDKYFKVRKSYREQRSISFEALWTLFPPGELVYGRPFQEQEQVFVPVNSLPFYPFRYHQEHDHVKQRLIDRGDKYRKFCTAKQGSRMFDYKGPVLVGKKGFSRMTGENDEDDTVTASSLDHESDPTAIGKSTNIDSRVMVDFESYYRYGPLVATVGSLDLITESQECMCRECQNVSAWHNVKRARFDEDAHQEDWEEEQFMLCPPRVLGYIFSDKQWAQLQVTLLRDIPKHGVADSWNRVKLADGEETKQMILNLVEGHGTANSKDDDSGLVVDDIVAKKGKGLVILLYGPPGVGKTSTAETVAIAARKPLFSISVADVGTQAKKVEANLAKIFALATSWQAILLIDEADVFLEIRGKGAASNTERNALVSVFLRVLEYYQGILMLTTNQIAHFDVAVHSRVHVAIKYGKLSEKQTMAIFEGFLTPLVEKNCVKDIDDIKEWIEEDVCKIGLDGRQIRNILTSALGLARAERKTKLEKKDLKKVLNNVRDYKTDFTVQFERYKNTQDGMVG